MSIDFAVASYSGSAVAFLLLSLLLLTRLKYRSSIYLAAACATTAAWAGTVAAYAAAGEVRAPASLALEVLRNLAWHIFLLSLGGEFGKKAGGRNGLTAVIAAAAGALLLVTYPYWSGTARALGAELSAFLLLAIVGMLLVEQLFRHVPEQGRWGIKFACLGIGGMFAYDFYLYSEALLFRRFNPDIWSTRGLVNILIAPALAASALRASTWSGKISISRRFLYNSVALFGSALYLLLMSAAGYYLRYSGGTWGSIMQYAFLFGALMLLAVVAFSGAFRSWMKVFISKHFYAYRYDYREEWIRFTDMLANSEHKLHEQAVQAVASLVESQGGALWINRGAGVCEMAGYWNMFASAHSAEPTDSELCQFMERKRWIIDLQELETLPDKYQHLRIPDWLKSMEKAWLVVPLLVHGKLFGFVVLAHSRGPVKLNWEVLDLLKIAGSQAASYLSQREAADQLAVARQFESYNRLSTFVVHDLKNLVAQLSLVVSNAEKFGSSPEFQRDMLETVGYSVEKMKLLLQKFNRTRNADTRTLVTMDELLWRVVASKSALRPRPALELADNGLQVHADPQRLERVISHFVLNAIEATSKEGSVTVHLTRSGDWAVITCEDTGQGMTEEFMRERLFKPFQSTKSTGMGIGIFEAREYIQELGGRIEVSSALQRGTKFCISLPLSSMAKDVLAAA